MYDYEIQPVLRSVSHHSVIKVPTRYRAAPEPEDEHTPKYSDFDNLYFHRPEIPWDRIDHKLSEYNWANEFRGKSTDNMLQSFYSVCYNVSSA